jgi:hypothetical protein
MEKRVPGINGLDFVAPFEKSSATSTSAVAIRFFAVLVLVLAFFAAASRRHRESQPWSPLASSLKFRFRQGSCTGRARVGRNLQSLHEHGFQTNCVQTARRFLSHSRSMATVKPEGPIFAPHFNAVRGWKRNPG